MIAVDENQPGCDGNSEFFFSTGTTTNRSIRYQNDNTNPDPAAPPTGTLKPGYPNVMLAFGDLPTVPVLSVNPDAWDFGTKFINTITPKEFSISNTGVGPLDISSLMVSGTGFALAEPFVSDPLPSGESTSFTVKFAPIAAGTHPGTITITSNAGPVEITLNGFCHDHIQYTLPWTESFETGNTQASAVSGWAQEDITSVQLWTANNTETEYNRSPRTGDWNAYLRYGSTRWMFKPVVFEAGVAYKVTVYARQDGDDATDASIGISYGTEPNAAGMTHTILAPTGIIDGDYQRLQGFFTPPTAGIYFVGIVGKINFSPWYISIDDITIEAAPTGIPDAVTLLSPVNGAANLPRSGFEMTWSPADTGGTPTSYIVFMASTEAENIYEEHTFEGITGTSFNPVLDGGLTLNYSDRWFWTVAAINNDGSAVPDTPFIFNIENAPALVSTFPYTMDFEDHADNSLPSLWTRSSLSLGWNIGDDLGSMYFDIPDHTVYAAANDDDGGMDGDGSMDMLIGPHFDFSGVNEGIPFLSFDSFYPGTYGTIATVEVCTNGIDWTVLKTVATNPAWQTINQNLSDYDGMSDVQIRFHADDDGEWASGWAIDNFAIDYLNIDLFEPIVEHYPIIGWPHIGIETVIIADIYDDLTWNSGITSATLNYSVDGGTEAQVPMTIVGDFYQAAIPGQAAGSLVAYYITAVDASAQLNTLTTDTWDFDVDSPVWLQYDANVVTDGIGLNTGAFGIMTGFENPFGAGNPCKINSIFARSFNATTANIHVYTYNGDTDTFTDVMPSFAQSFLAETDTVIPLNDCVSTAGYFYVAITDVPAQNFFAVDGTQAYYPGTHFVHFGAGISTDNLDTLENQGFPGSWLLRANIESGSPALDTPVVTITDGDTDITLSWAAVAGASSYKVYGATEPYAADPWTVLSTTDLLTYTYTGLEDMHFFKVVADSEDLPGPAKNATITRINNLVNNRSRKAHQAPKDTSNLKNRK